MVIWAGLWPLNWPLPAPVDPNVPSKLPALLNSFRALVLSPTQILPFESIAMGVGMMRPVMGLAMKLPALLHSCTRALLLSVTQTLPLPSMAMSIGYLNWPLPQLWPQAVPNVIRNEPVLSNFCTRVLSI